jgi:PTH1 family peptidyl-tRNA hydrolase
MTDRYLIIGLGNPGRKYNRNRHNTGFMTIDRAAERHGIRFSKLQSKAAVATGQMAGRNVLLAKPQSYMNNSGQPVRSLADFYKIPVDRLIVVYDDLDLPTGTVRLRPEGGSGGQNGMKDIIQHLGTREFARLRMGIGRPPGRMDPVDYVLQDFSKDEWEVMQVALDTAVDALETWLADGIQLAMSRYNGPVES